MPTKFSRSTLLKLIAGVLFGAMVYVNYLATSLPINNRSTGAISDAYPNLFAPAGITFAIWGMIYLLLGGYVVYQFTKGGAKHEKLLQKINPLFIASSVANIAWIYAWHYDYIGLSVLIMTALLISLIKIADITRTQKLTGWSKALIATPFSVYFGWITVATIANITVFLVSIGWNGFGLADYIWTSVILLVGAAIGITRLLKDRQIPYGFVLIWAYLGILLKHTSATGFAGAYPIVGATVVLCLVLFGFFIGTVLYKR
jgi:hypothetical protein